MLKIGDFSKLSRISIRMLRHYDENGLLKPEETDQFTGYRYYSEAQLPLAARITALKDMGFGLAVIPKILQDFGDPQELERYLRIKHGELEERSSDVQRRLRLVETMIQRLREDDQKMNYDVTLKTVPQRYVASVRQMIPAYDQECILWDILGRETAPLNLQPDDPSYGLAVFHDEGYKEGDVDVEIQFSVKGQYPDTEHVKFQTVAPIEIASATYQGSYDKITEANEAVANWMAENGYEISGTMFCIYHVSPAQTQNPEELVTEVCYPVRKK